MKTLSPALAAAVAGAATTLARAYIATRADGAVFGFTDHDRDLVVAGVTCRAATGVGGSEAVAAAGLGVGGQDIVGALASDAITEADIGAGLWDGAAIAVFLVDWSNPDSALHVTSAHLGEVTVKDAGFGAELRSLAAALDQPKGRLYQHRCDADLGDARCGIGLGGLTATGVVAAVASGRHVHVNGLAGLAPRRLAGGTLIVDGRRHTIKADDAGGAGARLLELWDRVDGLAVGDAVSATPGCDKRFETCRDRFANTLNFRGFPHIPGSDFVLAAAAASDTHDGGALMP